MAMLPVRAWRRTWAQVTIVVLLSLRMPLELVSRWNYDAARDTLDVLGLSDYEQGGRRGWRRA